LSERVSILADAKMTTALFEQFRFSERQGIAILKKQEAGMDMAEVFAQSK
jgi:hypothetical protein